MLGAKSRGLLKKLLNAKDGDLEEADMVLDLAEHQTSPRDYVARVIHNATGNGEDHDADRTATIVEDPETIEARKRQAEESRKRIEAAKAAAAERKRVEESAEAERKRAYEAAKTKLLDSKIRNSKHK